MGLKNRGFTLDNNLIVLDLETAGVDREQSSVIQIGAVKFTKEGSIDKDFFNGYIIPYTSYWSKDAEYIHNLSQETLARIGASVQATLKDFLEWVGNPDDYYIAQWSCGFDTTMLQQAFKYAAMIYPFGYISYDVASFVRLYMACCGYNTEKSLKKCAGLMGINTDIFTAHNAKDDAMLTAYTLQKVIERVLKQESCKSK